LGAPVSIITSPTVKAAVISPNGSLIAGTWAQKLRAENLSEQDYFRIPHDGKTNGLFIGKPVTSPGDGQVLIPISKRVETEPGARWACWFSLSHQQS
jgi:hypothetical protein